MVELWYNNGITMDDLGIFGLFEDFEGFHSHGGTPNSWMVYVMENPTQMDDDWGYPYFRKPPYERL